VPRPFLCSPFPFFPFLPFSFLCNFSRCEGTCLLTRSSVTFFFSFVVHTPCILPELIQKDPCTRLRGKDLSSAVDGSVSCSVIFLCFEGFPRDPASVVSQKPASLSLSLSLCVCVCVCVCTVCFASPFIHMHVYLSLCRVCVRTTLQSVRVLSCLVAAVIHVCL